MMSSKRFGQFIKELRTERRLTQTRLSELLHVTQSYITKIESGERIPDYAVLVDLAHAFNMTAGQLFDILAEEIPETRAVSVPKECTTEDIEAGLKYMRYLALERINKEQSSEPGEDEILNKAAKKARQEKQKKEVKNPTKTAG